MLQTAILTASHGTSTTTVLFGLIVVLTILFRIAVVGAIIYLFVLIVKALRKYIASKEIREEKALITKSLAEILKENRIRCKMTQEFVSEAIGVSRQAVSKWENGTSDPSTSNLIALAHLYGVSPEALLRGAVNAHPKDSTDQGPLA